MGTSDAPELGGVPGQDGRATARSMLLVAGFAASGKSSVGRRIAQRLPGCCYLDKDTLSSPLVDRLVVALGQAPGDRDSAEYQCEVRPLEYACLMASAWEASEFAPYVILSAPFIAQLVDPAWCSAASQEAARRHLKLRSIWVHCEQGVLRERMRLRGSPRDLAKLANWEQYAASLDDAVTEHLCLDHRIIDNTWRDLAEVDDALLAYVNGP